MTETLNTELWAPIDRQIHRQIHHETFEAQLHYLIPSDRQLLGAHMLERFIVPELDPSQVLAQSNERPSDALLLWMNFTQQHMIGNLGTPQNPRYTSTQEAVGELALNTGSGGFHFISELSELPPALRLWLRFYLAEKPHNHKRPLPHDLAELARQHNLDSERIEFRNQYDQENGPRVAHYPYDSDSRDITRFTARYADYLLQTAGASDPTIPQQPFWRAIEAQVTKTLEKRE